MSLKTAPASSDELREIKTAAIKRRRRFILLQVASVPGFFVALLVYFSLSSAQFGTYNNWTALLSTAALLGVVSIGQTLAIVSGGFDLSVSGTVPLAACSFVLLINNGTGFPLALLLTVLIGAGVGLVNGVVISRLGVSPLITTLGMMSITTGLALTLAKGQTLAFATSQETGDLISPAVISLADRTLGFISNDVLIFLFLTAAGFVLLRYTSFGRNIYALGGNPEAARLAGVRVNLLTTLVYVLSGALAAVAGVLGTSQLLAANGTLGADMALTSVTAVVLGGGSLTGGVGGILGTLVGVLIVGTLNNGLALLQVSSFYQQIVIGTVLLLAVVVSQIRNRFNSGR